MLIYFSTACDTVIIVFSTVFIHQKRLFSILNTCKAMLLVSCLCATIGQGSKGGYLRFVYGKKNEPAFLLLHDFLLGQKNNMS